MEQEVNKRYLLKQKKVFGLDFDDLINFTIVLFEDYPEVLAKWQEKLHYVQVDEFQDSSARQIALVDMVSKRNKNLFVVGDPDQTIYEWRGAKPGYFVDFNLHYPTCNTIILDENYRSTPEILDLGNALIKQNKLRVDQDMFTRNPSGIKVVHYHGKSEADEVKWGMDRISYLSEEKGVTMSEIADLIEKMYGHHYTPQTLSNMTKIFSEDVAAFKERALHDRYAAVYLDATYNPLKRKTVAQEVIHIAVGIRPDGAKEVLAYAIAPNESTVIWNEILEDLVARGVKDVLLFVTDGLKGMADTIHQVFPKAAYQHCCVHVSRNIASKVRVADRKEICEDFKDVYQAESKGKAMEARSTFAAKWQASYPKVVRSILENDHLLTFYAFPIAIRRSLYSTNLIESFNKQVKKYSRRKEQFQNEDSLDRFLVSLFENYNQKFLTRSHRGFQQTEGELIQMFEKLAEM